MVVDGAGEAPKDEEEVSQDGVADQECFVSIMKPKLGVRLKFYSRAKPQKPCMFSTGCFAVIILFQDRLNPRIQDVLVEG